MAASPHMSNYILAGGTLLAALFVAIQAFYARTSYVEASQTRFLEKKLDICFENFDAAAALDASLRVAAPEMMMQEVWPPRVEVKDAERLAAVQLRVVPRLDALQAGLTKASVLGDLDKYRAYLAQQLRGLSKRVLDVSPVQVADQSDDTKAVFAALSDFIGAQYSVFTGCRLIAEGKG